MHTYQSANNPDKMLEMGRKVLKIDPDDPEALVGVAQVLAERTRETDLDKDQRLDEGTKLALHAIETTDTDITVPAGTPQDKVDAYKGLPALHRVLRPGNHSVHAGKVCRRGKLLPTSRWMPSLPSPILWQCCAWRSRWINRKSIPRP